MFRTGSEPKPKGVALVFAIFLIVVVSGVLVLLMQWLNLGSQTSTNQVMHSRALAAAQSGLDYAIYQILKTNQCVSTTLSLTDGTLNGFTVVIRCSAYGPISEAGSSHTWYSLSARAYQGSVGQNTMVSREVDTGLWI